MDCNDSYLALFTKDSCLYLYSITASGYSEKTTIELALYHQVSLASVAVPLIITLLPENVKPSQSQQPASPSTVPHLRGPPQCLIHYTSGKLVLLHLAENREDELATDVEQPWLGTALTDFEESDPSTLPRSGGNSPLTSPRKSNLVSESAGRTLWAYGAQGLTVWVPFPGPHKQLMSRDRSLDFDNEVYPVGFVSDLGIVVGLTQGVSVGLGTPLPFFEIHTKTHPFLHSILRNKIESFDDAQALSIAKKFEYVPHFAHSLELLLHEVLESEYENQHQLAKSDPLSNTSLLSRVADFMRHFPQFPDIVVQCARKTDASYWQFFFDGVGDPRTLFEDCVNAGKLSTAASYLRILQNICHEGHIVARRAALVLLGKVLDIDDVELAGELTRFLGPVSRSVLSPSPSFLLNNSSAIPSLDSSSLRDIGIAPDDEEFYMQECQLARYARKLLSRKQLRHLLLFAWRVGHELRPWLVKQRKKSAFLDSLEEWKEALTALHLQFYIPKPDRLPPLASLLTTQPSISRNIPPSPLEIPSPLTSPMSYPQLSPLTLAASTPLGRKQLGLSGPNFSMHSIASLGHSSGSMIPDTLPPDPAGRISSEASSSLSLPSIRDPLFLQDSIQYATADLAYLQEEMLSAKCTEWGLIIATVLLNVPTIINILQSNSGDLWEKYRQLLTSQDSSVGYTELRGFLDEVISKNASTKLYAPTNHG